VLDNDQKADFLQLLVFTILQLLMIAIDAEKIAPVLNQRVENEGT
jgi:hypothetical protein